MTLAQVELPSTNQGRFTFYGPVNAADFDGSEFVSNPSGSTGLAVGQPSANVLLIDFDNDIDVDASVTLTTAGLGLMSPQTKNYS